MRRMSPTAATSTPEQVQETAARWFARLRGDAVAASTRAEFAAWLAADPAHAEEYSLLEQLWDNAARLQTRPRKSGRALATAALAAAALFLGWFNLAPPTDTLLSTVAGERRHVQLDDGSELDLAPQTQVSVRFGKGQRQLELAQGSIAISVAADAQRPFEVLAGSSRIRDIGTRFTVDRRANELRVGVAEGMVEVSPGDAQQTRQILRAGEALTIVDGEIRPVLAVDRNNLLAWTKGQLIFEEAPLSEVVAALNRFRKTPIVLGDPQAGRQRISGVFLIADEATAPLALARIAGLRFETQDGRLLARRAETH